MAFKLFIYEHCPFCVKARMIFGLKNIDFEKIVLLNDNETDPIRMIGKKMLPILEDDGRFIAESMDIVAHIDHLGTPIVTGRNSSKIANWLERVTPLFSSLIIPRIACAPFEDFATTAARAYFISKKEAQTGLFSRWLGESESLREEMNLLLEELAPLIDESNAVNGELSTDDFHLFAFLRSLSIVKNVYYPVEVATYLQAMSKASKIGLLDQFAV
ncbi:glutaredoxin 2 GrxB family [Zymomonas mobilis subsp. mobilis ZM4 = ATCC 31821]|uniref:Glutaredoxin, GrxB family n=1 Tax=Zymomonas mobilis subsp. mobilis (strain ATCC 31821 / ZM4 / CP4) TaxID=264203 RepID=Q5NQ08_ZYMMO|nr:GrxB family glutaredoxin [Zymomonas mobilis]AAV89197.1 glutaredoxin, GrxB family [Zymomonas mobilis subsp. mobilis ZM4 = ATCC 31821]ACV75228.1 glutaredoxin, GrxB family [Zymomonas mobilis subsp. mobilis NCIMB 11163]AHB10015.1 Glutaredoxin, GrxB family [Zymomonas mobilis subsp. mobilis str. CP4 = NRRL B-14023]AHJ70321.1 glutaredoxin 2 [Zymomonas mobilis subsp. mobilis NRRL B-12526]AHJ72176.1 glutaredoxin 2 [Zymomonas mobilis subsp. mobilis str. CP4 = NRRL B-14023]